MRGADSPVVATRLDTIDAVLPVASDGVGDAPATTC